MQGGIEIGVKLVAVHESTRICLSPCSSVLPPCPSWPAFALLLNSDCRRPKGRRPCHRTRPPRGSVPRRGPGGDPKSSLGGPRTAREVAGLQHQPFAQRHARFMLEAPVGVGRRRGQPRPPSCLVHREAELPPLQPFPSRGRKPVPRRPSIRIHRVPRSFSTSRSTKPGGFGLSGLRGEFAVKCGYSVVVPESGRSLRTVCMPTCQKQDGHAAGRRLGRWMKVVFMALGTTPYVTDGRMLPCSIKRVKRF